jgi:zinc protease
MHCRKARAQPGVLSLDPEVRKGTPANDFTYYIRHNEEPLKRAVFYLANKVGSYRKMTISEVWLILWNT